MENVGIFLECLPEDVALAGSKVVLEDVAWFVRGAERNALLAGL